MKTLTNMLLGAVAAVAVTSSAHAAFTLYTDYNSFTSAISLKNPGTISFSNITMGPFPNATFSNNGYVMNASSGGGLYGEPSSETNSTIKFLSVGGLPDEELLFTFSTNVFAVGGWFLATTSSNVIVSSFTTTIVDAGGATNIFTNNTTTYDNSFRGWVYDTNIVSMTLSTDPQNLGFPTAANNITLAVPEPSTYALLAIGAAGLAGYVIRRRRS